MVLIDLELFLLVPRVLMHAWKLFLCYFDASCRIFEKLAVFCKFSLTGTDFWATEACASMKRRASDWTRRWRLLAPDVEAGASLKRHGASVHARALLL